MAVEKVPSQCHDTPPSKWDLRQLYEYAMAQYFNDLSKGPRAQRAHPLGQWEVDPDDSWHMTRKLRLDAFSEIAFDARLHDTGRTFSITYATANPDLTYVQWNDTERPYLAVAYDRLGVRFDVSDRGEVQAVPQIDFIGADTPNQYTEPLYEDNVPESLESLPVRARITEPITNDEMLGMTARHAVSQAISTSLPDVVGDILTQANNRLMLDGKRILPL